MVELWWIIIAAIFLLAFLIWMWFPIRAGFRGARLAEARRDFHRQRERLEVKFLQLGMTSSRTDAPRWTDCEFEDDVVYARNRTTGELNAFVAVNIEMEDGTAGTLVTADVTGNFRAATAVFRFERRRWETDGRAIFNLSPTQAIKHYHRDLELVAQEASGKG